MTEQDTIDKRAEAQAAGCMCLITLVILISITIGVIAGIYAIKKNIHIPDTPIIIDSIQTENNKLILEVEHLDSIKNAEIIEVQSIDNDSTIKLFYKLIRN